MLYFTIQCEEFSRMQYTASNPIMLFNVDFTKEDAISKFTCVLRYKISQEIAFDFMQFNSTKNLVFCLL